MTSFNHLLARAGVPDTSPGEQPRAPAVAEWCAGLAGGLALAALAGWALDLRVLAGQWGTNLPMAPSTALALLFLGAGVFSEARWPLGLAGRRAAQAGAALASLLAVLVLAETLTGRDSGVQWLLARTNELFGGVPLGRMSPLAAAGFLLESLALVLLLGGARWRVAAAAAALVPTVANLVVLVGYFYGAPLLYGGATIPIALPTAVAFVLLGAGQLHRLLPAIPALDRWRGPHTRGLLVRAFLPAMLALIIIQGWIDVTTASLGFAVNPALWYALTALTASGLIVAIVGATARHIGNEIERSAAELIASELRYRRLFESARDGILILDAGTGMIVDVNPFLVELLGFSRESFLGKTVWDLGFFRDIIANKESFAELQREEYVRYGDKPLETRDGRRIDVEFVSNVYLVNGEKVIQCNIRDISERRRALDETAGLQAQLQQSQKMESVGRLAGGVAHDFNNMLGVILGHAELALARLDHTEPIHENLREIHGAAVRSAALTRQLLAFARKQTITPRVLDLNDTVAGMLKMLQRLIGEDIGLVWRPGVDVWPVYVDPSQLDQVLANLCVNARDAIAGVGEIAIESANCTLDEDYCAAHVDVVPGPYVRLTVSDDGCGMDTHTLSHLFEPFFTTKKLGEGTGLGLATVYGIVKQNHGVINAYSEPGQGTTLTVYLPRHAGKVARASDDTETPPALTGFETILLVEDEPAILTVTQRVLELQGYRVLAAGRPGEALSLAAAYPGAIHLLLTDVVMPEMNGRTLAKQLIATCPFIKRLFMSGYTADIIAHQGVLDQGVQFLQKPFSREDLLHKVRQVLDATD